MIILLGIVSVLLIASLAFNFFFIRFLKNTYEKLTKAQELILTLDCVHNEKAYDDKYYPCTLITQLKYDCEDEIVVTDFSRYETDKVVGIFVCSKEPYPEEEFAELGFERDEVEQPQILPKMIVYSPREGFWKWKSQD